MAIFAILVVSCGFKNHKKFFNKYIKLGNRKVVPEH